MSNITAILDIEEMSSQMLLGILCLLIHLFHFLQTQNIVCRVTKILQPIY